MSHQKITSFTEKWLEDNRQTFHDLTDFVWENPELGLEEFSAFTAVTDLLEKEGFSIEYNVADMPTAFIATYGTGGPVLGINVEYDCLPGLSQEKDKPYPSPIVEGAPGQGCGHNILCAAAVKGGIAIRHAIEEFGLNATVKLLGSPYEEASVGKA